MNEVVDILIVAILIGLVLTGIIWFIMACIPKPISEFLDDLEKFLEEHQDNEK